MAKRDLWRNTAAVSALLAGLTVGSGAALADFDDGVAAYEAGDYARAMEEWRPLAESGNADAQYWLGRLFERGEGVPASLARAAMWYRLAAGQDNVEAQTALDGVLETLRARETGDRPAQLADSQGAGAPGLEPERDPAYSPSQTPGRTADVEQPTGAPAREGQPAVDGVAREGDVAALDGDALDPETGGPGEDATGAEDGAGYAPGEGPGDGAGDAALADDGGPAADGIGDAATGGEDPATDESADVGAAVADAADPAADAAAIEADALEADLLADGNAPADEDAVGDDALAEDADAADLAADEEIGDLAALDEDVLVDDDPLAEEPVDPLAEDGLAEEAAPLADMPLPPALDEALADGALDAEEIEGLVEDGTLTEEIVDDLVESGMLDEAALTELAEAGVLDEAALDALVDAGLVDETMVDDAQAALADAGDAVVAEDPATVVDTIGDGVAQLFDDGDAPADPQRRLITARQ